MKKIFLFLALLSCLKTNAQTIDNVSIVPAIPTTNDSILITAICTFGSGSCSPHTQGFSVAGNSISTWALHCLGMLTVICTDTDTFAIGTLPAGIYTVNYQLNTGSGPVPCSPGIVPGPNTNATFTVSALTNISYQASGENAMQVFPNPVTGMLKLISNKLYDHGVIDLYNLLGKKVFHVQINEEAGSLKPETNVDVSELSPGIYFLKVSGEKSQQIIKIIKM